MPTYPDDPWACVQGCDDYAVEGGLCVRCAKDYFGDD